MSRRQHNTYVLGALISSCFTAALTARRRAQPRHVRTRKRQSRPAPPSPTHHAPTGTEHSPMPCARLTPPLCAHDRRGRPCSRRPTRCESADIARPDAAHTPQALRHRRYAASVSRQAIRRSLDTRTPHCARPEGTPRLCARRRPTGAERSGHAAGSGRGQRRWGRCVTRTARHSHRRRSHQIRRRLHSHIEPASRVSRSRYHTSGRGAWRRTVGAARARRLHRQIRPLQPQS